MARVFISHASEDLALADELRQWLIDDGHQIFLDQDLRDGIAVGEEWERRLHERLRWANAVVCVVTTAYLASDWCTAEVSVARSRGSRLLPVHAESGVHHPLLKSIQHTDLTRSRLTARAALIEALRRLDEGGDPGWPEHRSPFPGLRPLDVDRHRVYFGRAGEVEQLAELVRSTAEPAEGSVLLVVGASGCGKSSLVRAGLLPVMAGEPGWWTVPPIVPGADPAGALARALVAAAGAIDLGWTTDLVCRRLDEDGLAALTTELLLQAPGGPQRRLLIVVDQFEELITQTPAAQRARFVELLRPALTDRVQLVGTLRAEFLDRLLGDSALGALETHTYTLRPLRPEALRAVIEGPARLAGIGVDEQLVRQLIEDTDSGEALPLLAFTLAQLADGVRRGGHLSRTRYEQLGGVRGALTREADAALADAVSAGGRSREEVIAGVLRLVTVDEQGRPTRWRVDRAELPDPVAAELDAFVVRRLLTTDTDGSGVVIGAAHEAFLSAWSPLAAAIDENVSALRARRAVEHAATEWDDHARPPSRLWGGGQLAAAVTDTGARFHTGAPADGSSPAPARGLSRWLPGRPRVLVTDRVDVSSKARSFLQASIRRDRYRRGRAVTVLSALLVLALTAAGVAVVQQRTAQQRQLVATARQLMAQSEAVLDADPRTAMRLGIAAYHLYPGGETRSSLVNTLTSTRYAGALPDDTGSTVAFSPVGRRIMAAVHSGGIALWDVSDPARPGSLGQLRTSSSYPVTLTQVAFSPDGRMLAVGSSGGATLWDVSDPARLRLVGKPFAGASSSVVSVAFSSQGRTLATVGSDGEAILWDLADPARPRPRGQPLGGAGLALSSATFAPDGTMLATGSGNDVLVWDLTGSGQPPRLLHRLTGHTDLVDSVAFAPDGRTLAAGSFDRTVILWSFADRAHPDRAGPALTGHSDSVTSVAFSPDGRTLATGSQDGTTILWDLADRAQPGQTLIAHNGDPVSAVAFAPDGAMLATGRADGTVFWDLTRPAEPRRVTQLLIGRQVLRSTFSSDGRILATGSDDRAVLWDLSDMTRPRRLGQISTGSASSATSMASALSRKMLAIGIGDGTVIVVDCRDPARPRLLARFLSSEPEMPYAVESLAFAPDGRTLAAGSHGGTVSLWDLSDPARPRRLGQPLTGHTDSVNAVAFSPGGTILATGSYDRTVILWDLSDPARPRRLGQPLTGHTDSVDAVAFSPDGKTMATGSDDRTVILWDLSDPARPTRLGQLLAGHRGAVDSVAFAPDGALLATGSHDVTAMLWDLTDRGRPRPVGQPLTGHTGGLDSVEFGPSGDTMATSSLDGTVILWDLTGLADIQAHAMQRACAIAGGGLDREEWARYISGSPYQDSCPR